MEVRNGVETNGNAVEEIQKKKQKLAEENCSNGHGEDRCCHSLQGWI